MSTQYFPFHIKRGIFVGQFVRSSRLSHVPPFLLSYAEGESSREEGWVLSVLTPGFTSDVRRSIKPHHARDSSQHTSQAIDSERRCAPIVHAKVGQGYSRADPTPCARISSHTGMSMVYIEILAICVHVVYHASLLNILFSCRCCS